MDTALSDRKNALRAVLRQRLAHITPEERLEWSARLVANLVALPGWKTARRLLLFAPLPSEPDIDPLWLGEALAGKECAYPRVEGIATRLYFVGHVAELEPTRWGLREPVPVAAREADLGDFDLMLVPGLAFDPNGGRLGRGGGFYDRLLAGRGKKPLVIGVGFECQRVPELVLAPHDVRLDSVCTEEGVLAR